MHLLSFTVGDDFYAVETRHVVEVLPFLAPRPIPHAPAHVAGVFTYRGSLVAVIDMARLLGTRALRDRLGTRTIVTEHTPPGRTPVRVGIAAENVLVLLSTRDAENVLSTPRQPAAPYLGPLLRLDGRTIQIIAVEHLSLDAVEVTPPRPPASDPS